MLAAKKATRNPEKLHNGQRKSLHEYQISAVNSFQARRTTGCCTDKIAGYQAVDSEVGVMHTVA